jgi:plasmid maintenance system killer protein
MRIWFKSKKLERTFGSDAELRKAFGQERARKIQMRMLVLRFSPRLAGDRLGQFAVDVQQPYRLIIAPISMVTKGKGGKIDPSEVTEIVILGVEDYHGD